MRKMISLSLQAVSGVMLLFYCFVTLFYQPILSWGLFPLLLGGTLFLISKFAGRSPRPRYAPVLVIFAPMVIGAATAIRSGGALQLSAAYAIVGVLLLSLFYIGAVVNQNLE